MSIDERFEPTSMKDRKTVVKVRIAGDEYPIRTDQSPEHTKAVAEHVDRTIGLIHESGCTAGLVFNPATPLEYLDHVMDKVDLVLIMSVNPGFGGQSFIESAIGKIREARKRIDASGRDIWLEVDGGIKAQNIASVARAGADTFVAGSAIFGEKDRAGAVRRLRDELKIATIET